MRLVKRTLRLLLVVMSSSVVLFFSVLAYDVGPVDATKEIWSGASQVATAGFRLVVAVNYHRRARSLRRADVQAEVTRAVADGDYRLVSIMGIGPFYPGLDDVDPRELHRVVGQFGSRHISGTGDVIYSDAQREFQSAAHEYAERYNELIFPKIPD